MKIMKSSSIAICLLMSSACFADDPISSLTQRLNSEIHGLWVNGAQPSFTVSSNSTPPQVVEKAAQAWRIVKGTNDTLRILEIRKVELNGPSGSPWMAALVECDSIKRILLFRSEGGDHWWTRFYDVQVENAITRAQALKTAEVASRNAMQIPDDVQPVVQETSEAFIVTYPITPSQKQARAADYYTQVTVDKRSGKVTDFKVGS